MRTEYWGSLSVADHVDTAALATNVLLYDRLVVPVMTEQPDRDERAYWVSHGWDPDLQAKRLDTLAELAVPRPWDRKRRARFSSRFAELSAEQQSAGIVDRLGLTKMVLAEEKVLETPPGVLTAEVIAAYNSTEGVKQEFRLEDEDVKAHLGAQALLITRRLAVPDLPKPEETLALAMELSRDPQFQGRRAALFDWQRGEFAKRYTPEQAVAHLVELTDRYNETVREATKNVRWNFAFVVAGAALGFLGGPAAIATATVALSFVQFRTLNMKPALPTDDPSRAAAMFHDIEERVGLRLKR